MDTVAPVDVQLLYNYAGLALISGARARNKQSTGEVAKVASSP